MPLCPQELGSFTTAAQTVAPTTDTEGYATFGARYVNVWAQASGAIPKWFPYVFVYRTGIGWVRFQEQPKVLNALTATNGLLLEIEIRGAERIYVRRVGTGATNGATATVMIEGFSYR